MVWSVLRLEHRALGGDLSSDIRIYFFGGSEDSGKRAQVQRAAFDC